jgi:hypothetical protein
VVKDQHQPRWNEWDDEEPKAPTKEESIPPKSNPQTKQVWKEKVTSSPSQDTTTKFFRRHLKMQSKAVGPAAHLG